VAHGRAGRARRFVEVDRALFGGDESCQCDDRLRDGRPVEDAPSVSAAAELALARERRNGYVLGRPGVGELKRFQGVSILRT
jgi:hypothetical protein